MSEFMSGLWHANMHLRALDFWWQRNTIFRVHLVFRIRPATDIVLVHIRLKSVLRAPVQMSALHWLTAEQASEIGQAFDLFDVDRDGFLNTHELKVPPTRGAILTHLKLALCVQDGDARTRIPSESRRTRSDNTAS